jgi:hypothetical protein
MDRDAIITTSASLIGAASKYFELERTAEEFRGIVPARAEWDFFRLAAPLIEILERQPELIGGQRRALFGSLGGVHPQGVFRELLKISVEKSPEIAVDWLERVVATTTARMRLITEIHGLEPPEGGIDVNGVRLLRLSELQETRQTNWMKLAYGVRRGGRGYGEASLPDAAGVLKIESPIPIFADEARLKEVQATTWTNFERVARTVRAFTATVSGAPTIGRQWAEYDDGDVDRAKPGFHYYNGIPDGPRYFGSEKIDETSVALVARCLAFEGQFARKLGIAIGRLNLARRRPGIGDKAIEGSICLEALLGDDRFDMTYKISLRAALLIETGLEQRQMVMKTVKHFYNRRSAAVHGSELDGSLKDAKGVKDGLEICARVVKRVIELGRIPQWEAFEMSAGGSIDFKASS